MTASRANPMGRDEHARSGDDALGDRVAERDIGEVVRIGKSAPKIAHGGEAGLNRGLGVRDHLERELGNVLVQHAETQLVVVAGKVEGEVRVRVHEPGREGGIAQLDDLRVLGDGDVAPGGDDGVALDDDDAVRQKRFRFTVEEARRFQRNDGRRCVGRKGIR